MYVFNVKKIHEVSTEYLEALHLADINKREHIHTHHMTSCNIGHFQLLSF